MNFNAIEKSIFDEAKYSKVMSDNPWYDSCCGVDSVKKKDELRRMIGSTRGRDEDNC